MTNDIRDFGGFTEYDYLCLGVNTAHHRGEMITQFVSADRDQFIGNIQVCVVSIDNRENWLIVPLHSINDAKFDDIGPFTKLDEALVHLRLVAEAK